MARNVVAPLFWISAMIGRTFAAWRSALAFGRSFPTTSLAKAGLIAFVGYVHFEYTHGSASEGTLFACILG